MVKEIIKLKTTLSPELEQKIISFEMTDDNKTLFLNEIQRFYEKEKHALLFLSHNLKSSFYSTKKNKLLFDNIINRKESRIILLPFPKIAKCVHISSTEIKNESEFYIFNSLYEYTYPFIIDDRDKGSFLKNCIGKCSNIFCKNTTKIGYTNLKEKSLQNLSQYNIKNWIFFKENINELNIKKFLIVLANFFNVVDQNRVQKIKNTVFSDSFISDIKSESTINIREVLVSIGRSLFFNKGEFKYIDSHRNPTFSSWGSYDIFRLDSLPINRTGNGGSGTNRIIYAIKKPYVKLTSQIIYLAYTNKHDIEKNILKTRINKIIQSNNVKIKK